MRAVLEKEISNGTQSYQLWRAAGKPDLSCPRAENDRYILHMEINGYLAPLKMTDFILIDICGFEPAAQNLYSGKEKRGAFPVKAYDIFHAIASAESAYKQGEFVVYSLAPNTRLIMAENSETGETTEWKEF